ncbi:MAG: DeoR family transcriptional regulator [Candidatus Obscuribacterales bacterium]|nr:DeoR family transcriptional regulator [Candidatus Obscuribacterales bacterium]
MKKSKKNELVIGVRTDAELSKEFLRAWKDAEKHRTRKCPGHHLYFDSLDTLWRKLTPRRTELLQALRQKGPLSIRKLAAYLERDYKNVRLDIWELTESDLVRQTNDGLFMVPWDSIDLQIPLSAAS